MEIRFVSSLTPDDENRVASAVVALVAHLFRDLPIAYALRVETACGEVLHDAFSPSDARKAPRLDQVCPEPAHPH